MKWLVFEGGIVKPYDKTELDTVNVNLLNTGLCCWWAVLYVSPLLVFRVEYYFTLYAQAAAGIRNDMTIHGNFGIALVVFVMACQKSPNERLSSSLRYIPAMKSIYIEGKKSSILSHILSTHSILYSSFFSRELIYV